MSVAASIWLPAKTAADRMGVTRYALHKMAFAGKIRVKADNGELPKFHAGDVDRIAAERRASA